MNPVFDHSQIDNYLKGKMIPVQEQAFELRLQSEAVLLAETMAYARIHELSLPDKAIFHQAPKKQEVEKSETEKTGFDWQWLLLLLLILAIAYYFLAM